jgi:hypothetical protein
MVKRMPLFAFPTVWNNALGNKNNRKHFSNMRELKNLLLLTPPPPPRATIQSCILLNIIFKLS